MQHSDQIKAQVLAAIAAGTSVLAVSRQFKVSPSTIRMWRGAAGITPVVSAEKKQDLGVLIAEYLDAGLQALAAQARLVSDPVWIAKQDADKLAILHGVIADKLARILTSIEPVDAD